MSTKDRCDEILRLIDEALEGYEQSVRTRPAPRQRPLTRS
jgi:hypothetical protein